VTDGTFVDISAASETRVDDVAVAAVLVLLGGTFVGISTVSWTSVADAVIMHDDTSLNFLSVSTVSDASVGDVVEAPVTALDSTSVRISTVSDASVGDVVEEPATALDSTSVRVSNVSDVSVGDVVEAAVTVLDSTTVGVSTVSATSVGAGVTDDGVGTVFDHASVDVCSVLKKLDTTSLKLGEASVESDSKLDTASTSSRSLVSTRTFPGGSCNFSSMCISASPPLLFMQSDCVLGVFPFDSRVLVSTRTVDDVLLP
jgi:hypothetical protein